MLEVEPEQRFARLDDIVHILVGTTMPVALPSGGAVKKPVRPSLLFMAGGLVLVVLALSQVAPEISKRLFSASSLAETLIDNQGTAALTIGTIQPGVVPESYQWMTTAITGILAHTLHGDGINVSWVPAGSQVDPDPRAQRSALNAPLYVGGDYALDPALELVSLNLTFVDDANVRTVQVEGSAHQLTELAQEAATRIRRAAGLPKAAPGSIDDTSNLLLKVAERELRTGRNVSALHLLEQGRNASVPNAALLSELSYVLLQAGNRAAAEAAARTGLSSADGDQRGRLLCEAAAAWSRGDVDAAANHYATLQRDMPDDPVVKLRRSAALIEAGQARQALAILDGVPTNERAQNMLLYTLRARAENDTGDFVEALQDATRAIELGKKNAADIPLGEALLQAGRAHRQSDDVVAAKQHLDEADILLQTTGGADTRVRVLEELIALERSRSGLAAAANLERRLADLRSPPAR